MRASWRFLFGGGAGGTTCACNGQNDGVTNPAPINGNVIASELAAAGTAPAQVTPRHDADARDAYAADDDGGFFRWRAWQYYQDGAMTLATVSGTPPVKPRGVRIVR